MNKQTERNGHDYLRLFDHFVVSMQSLYDNETEKNDNPIINIDCTKDAKKAPFIYDTANSILHRKECRHIDRNTASSHFAIWIVDKGDLKFACKRCNPLPKRRTGLKKDLISDVLYGMLSLIDQFGSALMEKGKEYKKTKKGKQVSKSMDELLSGLDGSQQQIIDTAATTLDKLISSLQEYNEEIKKGNITPEEKAPPKRKKTTGKKKSNGTKA